MRRRWRSCSATCVTATREAVIDAMSGGFRQVPSKFGIPATPLTWHEYHDQARGSARAVARVVGKAVDPLRLFRWVRRHDVVIVPGMGSLRTARRCGRTGFRCPCSCSPPPGGPAASRWRWSASAPASCGGGRPACCSRAAPAWPPTGPTATPTHGRRCAGPASIPRGTRSSPTWTSPCRCRPMTRATHSRSSSG